MPLLPSSGRRSARQRTGLVSRRTIGSPTPPRPSSAQEDAAAVEEAARKKRHQALGEYLDEWEAEHGAFTEEELAETAEKLGWPWPPETKAAQ